MIKMTWFETEEDLSKLTGLDHAGLRAAGFDLDDWDAGIRASRKLHRDPSPQEIKDGEYYDGQMVVDWDREGHWLMFRMDEYCTGASYVKLGRWHYYLIHHA